MGLCQNRRLCCGFSAFLIKILANFNLLYYNTTIIKYKVLKFRGGVKFPTGGIARELATVDLVRFQSRQYSLDGRNKTKAGGSFLHLKGVVPVCFMSI